MNEFIGSELIAFTGAPGQVDAGRAFVFRADAVFPVIAGNKVAAGPADDGGIEFLGAFDNIFAKTLFISQRGTRFIETAVDAASQMFCKVAIDQGLISPT